MTPAQALAIEALGVQRSTMEVDLIESELADAQSALEKAVSRTRLHHALARERQCVARYQSFRQLITSLDK